MPLQHLVYILPVNRITLVISSDMADNSQRSLGSVSFSKSTSNTKSKTKSSVASKSSIPKPSLKQARRNVVKLCCPLQTEIAIIICARNLLLKFSFPSSN